MYIYISIYISIYIDVHVYIYIYMGGALNVTPLIVHITHSYCYKSILTSCTELILIGLKIVPNEEHFQFDHRFASHLLANEPLNSSQLFDTTSLCGP